MTSLVSTVDQLSLPRDCLQAERSLLQQCKFAGVLSLMSFAVLLDLSFDGEKERKTHLKRTDTLSLVIGIAMFVVSGSVLLLGLYNYFDVTYRLVGQRTLKGITVPLKLVLIIVMIVLLALNIIILVTL